MISPLAFAASLLHMSQAFPHHPPSKSHQISATVSPPTDASSIISAAVAALGGATALNKLENITYHAPDIYRSQTLTQSYNLEPSDQTVATSGSQNLSFNFVGDHLYARVERSYHYDAYWIWAFPDLQPTINFTYVLSDGPGGVAYACFIHGHNSFFVEDPSQALGYADDYLADYLYHHAQTFAIPGLISFFAANTSSLRTNSFTDPLTKVTYPAVDHTDLGVTLVLDQTNNLPYMLRSYENHAIFGPSTNDIVFSDYRPVKLNKNATLNLPHRFQTVYNSKEVIEDFIVESIALNPNFPNDFFTPLPISFTTPSAPSTPLNTTEYTRSEVHAFYEAGLWSGAFTANISQVVTSHPAPSIPQVHAVYIGDYADYVQLVVEFDSGVLVTDAPPHRSSILIEWIQETLHKNVTHVVPSHHHHDHAYGLADYARAGATIVVPDVVGDFYKNVNNGDVTIHTYNKSAPFILSDDKVQFRSSWHPDPPHARDWTYGLAMPACSQPQKNASNVQAVLFNADVWSPGEALRFDLTGARQWLDFLVKDGIPRDSVVVGAHGSVDSDGGDSSGSTTQQLKALLDMAAFQYPDFGMGVMCGR